MCLAPDQNSVGQARMAGAVESNKSRASDTHKTNWEYCPDFDTRCRWGRRKGRRHQQVCSGSFCDLMEPRTYASFMAPAERRAGVCCRVRILPMRTMGSNNSLINGGDPRIGVRAPTKGPAPPAQARKGPNWRFWACARAQRSPSEQENHHLRSR